MLTISQYELARLSNVKLRLFRGPSSVDKLRFFDDFSRVSQDASLRLRLIGALNREEG